MRLRSFESYLEDKLETLLETHASEASETKRKGLEQDILYLALALSYEPLAMSLLKYEHSQKRD